MRVSSQVLVDGQSIRFSDWEVSAEPGNPVESFRVTPLEPATQFDPATLTVPKPVVIRASIAGQSVAVIPDGHLDTVQDGVVTDQRTGAVTRNNQLGGKSDAYKLFARAPRRDTVFVPTNIIEQVYPHGVKITTRSGEQVIGYTPEQEPLYGQSEVAVGAGSRIFGGGGPTLMRPSYRTMDETSFKAPNSDECGVDNRAGPVQPWVESVPPVIVTYGPALDTSSLRYGAAVGEAGTHRDINTMKGINASFDAAQRSSSSSFSPPPSAPGSADTFSGKATAKKPLASSHALVSLIAAKAGFAGVVNNTPEIGISETLTVSAGSPWIGAIASIVGPWNPEIFVVGNTLHILDLEAANLSGAALTVGGDSATAINRSISRLPPYQAIDIIGTLRRGLREREASIGVGGNLFERSGASPGGVATVPLANIDSTPHIGPFINLPYNLVVTRTYAPSSTNKLNGQDRVDWTSLVVERGFFIDPESQQSSLVYQSTTLSDREGPISVSTYRSFQHLFDDHPHGSQQEQYGRFKLLGPGIHLLRRTTTTYNDASELDGAVESHTLTEALVVTSVSRDGKHWKATIASDASASGTIDLGPGSTDSTQFCAVTESNESYQTADQNVAVKSTVEVDYIGGRPPRESVEIIFRRHRGGGDQQPYDPRQRFCYPINDDDGEGTKSLVAPFVADERTAGMLRDRAKRRSGQRHEEVTVELATYLPRVRKGTAVRLAPTPLRSLDASGNPITVSTVYGNYFIIGYRHRGTVNQGTGSHTVTTQLMLRTAF